MCTARRAGAAGFTFLEMVIVMALLSVMSIVLSQTLASTQEADQYIRAVERATARGERVALELRAVVGTSHRTYARDATGTGYLAALDLSAVPPRPGARLPVPDERPLGPDLPGEASTGNVLLLVRESDPAPCVSNASSKETRAVDTYRFICVYPSETTRRLLGGVAASDLVVWRSEEFPSYAQLLTITDLSEQRSVIRDLVDRFGHDYACDPSRDVDEAFFALGANGSLATTPTPGITIAEDVELSERGRLVYADVQLARTDATSARLRSVLTADDPALWTPDGLEVKFGGEPTQRQVWIHLTVESHGGRGRSASHALTLVASTQDL